MRCNTFLYLELGSRMNKEECGRSGLGQTPGLGQGSGVELGLGPRLGSGLEPWASWSTFLPVTPSPLSSDGIRTTTSFSTKPESNLCSAWDDKEQEGLGGRLGAWTAARDGCLEEESGEVEDAPAGASCFSNQSGFWLMCWCMLQMET